MDYHITIKTQRGTSLIEICITVVIIAITTLVILSFSRSTLNMSRDTRGRNAACLSAENKIIDLKKMASPVTGNDQDTIENLILKRTWTVKDTNAIKRAIISVTYTSLKGTNRTFMLAGAIN